MKKYYHFSFLILLVLFTAGFFFLNQKVAPKVAYVRSQDLVYNYLGTKEVQSEFEGKKSFWQGNIDTLRIAFTKAEEAFKQNVSRLSTKEVQQQKEKLLLQQQQLNQYTSAIQSKAAQEDEEMMQGVLNQVNSFVKEYAENKGYDIILGTTLSGSVLYGREEMDITDELLEALNQYYQHGKKSF